MVDRSVVSVWRLRFIAPSAFLVVFTLVAEVFWLDVFALPLICIAETLCLVLCAVFLPPIAWRKLWFHVNPSEIHICRGIINTVHTVVPVHRIQHIDVKQSFLEKNYGISSLALYTAGTKGADIVIPGLPIEYCEQLRDWIRPLLKEEEE